MSFYMQMVPCCLAENLSDLQQKLPRLYDGMRNIDLKINVSKTKLARKNRIDNCDT